MTRYTRYLAFHLSFSLLLLLPGFTLDSFLRSSSLALSLLSAGLGLTGLGGEAACSIVDGEQWYAASVTSY
jgi:hypothetical protein